MIKNKKSDYRMKNLGVLEKIVAAFLLLTVVFGLYQYFLDIDYFDALVQEDSFYENLTSLFLFFASLTLFSKFFTYQKYYGLWWKVGVLLMAMGMFFGAGEEISWGQRIFGIQSGDFFKANNAQEETNLHNLVVGNVKLNKLIFSNLISICFGIYFLILPILWKISPKFHQLINTFGISVARPVHIIIFLVITLLILISIVHNRKWEMWEYAFALIMFLIVYNPWNSLGIFTKKNQRKTNYQVDGR